MTAQNLKMRVHGVSVQNPEDLLNYDKTREAELAPVVAVPPSYGYVPPDQRDDTPAPWADEPAPDTAPARTPQPSTPAPQRLSPPTFTPSTPFRPSPTPPRDYSGDLAAAQKQANDAHFLANVGRAGQAAISMTSGVSDGGLYEALDKQADQPVRDAQARIAIDRQAAEQTRAHRAADARAALTDPSSLESRRMRDVFKATHPLAPALLRQMGDTAFDGLAASDLPDMRSTVKTLEHLDEAMKHGAELDPTSAASRDAQDSAIAVLKATGVDMPPSVEAQIRSSNARDVQRIWISGLRADQQRKWQDLRADHNDLLRQERDDDRAKRQAEMNALRQDKGRAAEDAKLAMQNRKFYAGPDWELSPESQPTDIEARTFRKAIGQTDHMKQGIKEIGDLYKQYGTEALPTEAKARMQAIARDLQLISKGEAMYGLGVLNGKDLDLLEQLIPNPGASSANALAFIGGDQTLAKLDQLGHQLDSRLTTSAKALGYHRRGQAGGQAQGSQGAQGQRITRTVNGRTYEKDANGDWLEVER